jgi:hypothetical protein
MSVIDGYTQAPVTNRPAEILEAEAAVQAAKDALTNQMDDDGQMVFSNNTADDIYARKLFYMILITTLAYAGAVLFYAI